MADLEVFDLNLNLEVRLDPSRFVDLSDSVARSEEAGHLVECPQVWKANMRGDKKAWRLDAGGATALGKQTGMSKNKKGTTPCI